MKSANHPTFNELVAYLIAEGWPAPLALREARDRLEIMQQETSHQITTRLHSVLGEG